MIDEDRAPGALGQQRGGDLLVGGDAHPRAPMGQPAGEQRAFDRRRRDDHHVHSGKVGRSERCIVAACRARQRQRNPKGCAGAGHALDRDAAAHALDDALGNRKAQSGATEPAGDAAVGLLELLEDALVLVGPDADAGVAHQDVDLARPDTALDDDGDATAVGELHRIACQIEQHLPQPRGVAGHPGGQSILHIGGDLELLGLRAGRDQFDRLFDQRGEVECAGVKVDAAGFDLGEIEDLVDQREQRVARGLHRLDVGGLLRRERRVAQEVGHPEDAVERGAHLVRDHRQEARLRAVGGLRLVARIGERAFGLHAVGDVAADALQLGAGLAARAHHYFAPGDPARAGLGGDLLVVDAGAVGGVRGGALLEHRQREGGSEQRLALPVGEHAERVVDIGDAPVGVAARDHVALRGQKALGALFRFLELPMAVGQLLGALLQRAQLAPERTHAREQQAEGAAGRAEQPGHTDRERVRIVVHRGIADRGQEAECGTERHREDDGAANDGGQNPAAVKSSRPSHGSIPHHATPPRAFGMRVAGARRPCSRCLCGDFAPGPVAIAFNRTPRCAKSRQTGLTGR